MATRVQIAFDLAANGVGSYFTLDDPVKGVLDNATYKLAGDVLVDVTSSVRSISTKRGRSRQLDRFVAGSSNLVIDNRNRYFDPTYGPTIGGTRTNLVTNPSFEVDTTGWSAFGGLITLSRITTEALYGTGCAQIVRATNTGVGVNHGIDATSATYVPVTVGQSYTASASVKQASGDPAVFITIAWMNAGGGYITETGSVTISASTSWKRISVTSTAPANADKARILIRESISASEAAATWLVDAIMLEAGSTLNAYFDGTTADPSISVNSQTWNGTANASTSTLVWNSDPGSPYYGSVVPGKQITIDRDGVDMYVGNVADWNYEYDLNGDATALPSCTDGFAFMATQKLTAGSATAQLTGARIESVLTAINWPTAQRSIAAGQATLDGDYVPDGTNALAYLQKVGDYSEPGAFFISRDGLATFKDRAQLQAYTSGISFGTTNGSIPYVDFAVVYGIEEMTNTIEVTYTAGTVTAGTAIASNATSQAKYGVLDAKIDTVLGSLTDAQALANWQVALYAEPQYRVDSITVNLDSLSAAQIASILAIDLGDAVSVTPPNGSVAQIVSIDGIEHRATPQQHLVTFTMSETLAAFILDSAIFGILDTNVLGF
jgi:hypothetical protein